jgi:Fe2+ or Zn2+ uptake regulation protein
LADHKSDRADVTGEDLAAEVQARAPDIHLTTVYRNLNGLERLDVVDRTPADHGAATYRRAPQLMSISSGTTRLHDLGSPGRLRAASPCRS